MTERNEEAGMTGTLKPVSIAIILRKLADRYDAEQLDKQPAPVYEVGGYAVHAGRRMLGMISEIKPYGVVLTNAAGMRYDILTESLRPATPDDFWVEIGPEGNRRKCRFSDDGSESCPIAQVFEDKDDDAYWELENGLALAHECGAFVMPAGFGE